MLKNILAIATVISIAFTSCSKVKGLVPADKALNLGNKANVEKNFKSGAFIKIACEGTSLTYGEDIKGTDTVSASLPNGPTRAINQYPSTMRQALNNAQITISLRGYPGDRTTDAIERWKDSTSADICIIEYGTNDAYNFAGYATGTVAVNIFTNQLRQLAERRINQGAWVIICLSPYLESGDRALTAYRDSAQAVAKALYIPVFDVEQSIQGLPSPYSDVVHFNSTGYQKWGVDIAKLIQAGIEN